MVEGSKDSRAPFGPSDGSISFHSELFLGKNAYPGPISKYGVYPEVNVKAYRFGNAVCSDFFQTVICEWLIFPSEKGILIFNYLAGAPVA